MGTTYSATGSVLSMTSDAIARTLWGILQAAIQATGLTQCTSPEVTTAQINLTTVTRPATASTEAGFEVYKFTDNGTVFPVYIRVGYCTGLNTSGNIPAITFQVGTGVNTSGVLTGNVGAVNWISPPGTGTPTNVPWIVRARGDGHSLQFAVWDDVAFGTNFYGGVFSVSRSRTSAGVEDARYVHVCCAGNPSNISSFGASSPPGYFQIIYNPTGGLGTVYPSSALGPVHRCFSLLPGSLFSESNAGLTAAKRVTGASQYGYGVFPVFPNIGPPDNHCLDLATYMLGDIEPGGLITIPIFGANHTYIALGGIGWFGNNTASNFTGMNGNTWAHTFAMLWE